jgi:RPA family protein
MSEREVAQRVFAKEFNDSTLSLASFLLMIYWM